MKLGQGERQKEMVEESLDWSRKLEPLYKASQASVGNSTHAVRSGW